MYLVEIMAHLGCDAETDQLKEGLDSKHVNQCQQLI